MIKIIILTQNSTMLLKDWLSLIALFLSAIFAVLIGQFLQWRKSKKEREYANKFSVFASILGLRHARAHNEQFVIALNQIPIVFHKNKDVLNKLNNFIDTHSDKSLTESTANENLRSDLNDLVLEIAKDLGYMNIDNKVMRTFYNPDASSLRYNTAYLQNKISEIQSSQTLSSLQNRSD